MAHSNSWDETQPTNATAAPNIDDEIRKLRLDIRERMAVDHNLTASDAGAATVGYHKQITFEDDIADPAVSGDVAKLYTKKLSADSNIAPFFRSNVGGIVRVLLGDANFKVWLYSATAPVGMKATAGAPSDRVLAAVGGTTYTTAGATAGSWTITGMAANSHTHTVDIWASDKTGTILTEASVQRNRFIDGHVNWTDYQLCTFTGAGKRETTAGSGSVTCTHTAGWRVSAAVNKLYEPDLTV